MTDPGFAQLLIIFGIFAVLCILSLTLESRLTARFQDSLRILRTLVLPSAFAAFVVKEHLGYPSGSLLSKASSTALGFTLVWLMASALKTALLTPSSSDSIRSRTPRLLVDILRLLFVVVGFLLVYSNVWHKDISPLLTTFGVGSLVLGLALQDTLGNLFAGLALVFERPIAVGDWIQVGDQIGRIQQINWRSVRIVTRELTEITIPNSAISKERIQNFSSPSRMHGFKVTCGFSYDAPPNVVKEMLCSAAAETPGIIPTPAPEARTQEFGAYAIQYDLRVFIGDFNDLIAIRNELMSRIWYSARRRGIGIPYPITTLYKTEIPYTPDHATRADSIMKAIKAAALFKELSAADMQQLAEETTLERFGSGERVIKEGDVGDCFYIIVEGRCSVMVNSKDSRLVPVATLEEGSVVGEMSLLSGNPRQASVFASSELLLARISKEALGHLLTRHPEMVQSFAHYTAERATEIGMALDKDSLEVTTSEATKVDEGALRERLRRFFGLG